MKVLDKSVYESIRQFTGAPVSRSRLTPYYYHYTHQSFSGLQISTTFLLFTPPGFSYFDLLFIVLYKYERRNIYFINFVDGKRNKSDANQEVRKILTCSHVFS